MKLREKKGKIKEIDLQMHLYLGNQKPLSAERN